MSHIVVAGARGGSTAGTPAPLANRLEIHDFVRPDNIEQFSLFAQAFSKQAFVLPLMR